MSAQVADCRLLNFYLILVSAWFWNIVPVLMTEVYIPHNPFLQSKIANKIIENFFDDCYVVKAGREATTAFTGAVMCVLHSFSNLLNKIFLKIFFMINISYYLLGNHLPSILIMKCRITLKRSTTLQRLHPVDTVF